MKKSKNVSDSKVTVTDEQRLSPHITEYWRFRLLYGHSIPGNFLWKWNCSESERSRPPAGSWLHLYDNCRIVLYCFHKKFRSARSVNARWVSLLRKLIPLIQGGWTKLYFRSPPLPRNRYCQDNRWWHGPECFDFYCIDLSWRDLSYLL